MLSFLSSAKAPSWSKWAPGGKGVPGQFRDLVCVSPEQKGESSSPSGTQALGSGLCLNPDLFQSAISSAVIKICRIGNYLSFEAFPL